MRKKKFKKYPLNEWGGGSSQWAFFIFSSSRSTTKSTRWAFFFSRRSRSTTVSSKGFPSHPHYMKSKNSLSMGLRILEKFFKVRSLRLTHQLFVQFLFFLNMLLDDSIFHMNILIFIINHAAFPRDGCLLLFDMDSSDRITDEDFLNQLHKLD